MTTLHAGGKFNSGAYQTSGGLHGVGVSVVNALAERLEVEVARGQTLYRQVFARGAPLGRLETIGRVANRRGTKLRFKADPQIFRGKSPASVRRDCSRWRGPRPICSAASKSAGNARNPSSIRLARRRPRRFSISPAASRTISPPTSRARHWSPSSSSPAGWRSPSAMARWNGRWPGWPRTTASSIPIATPFRRPTAAPMNPACASLCCAALKDHAERIGQGKRASAMTAEDLMAGCAAMVSVFIREPEFQGQNKSRLMSVEASRIVENAMRDAFDHWLAGSPAQAKRPGRLGDRARRGPVCAAAPKRMSRARAATRKLRLPGKLADCTQQFGAGLRTVHRRRRFGGRLGQTGARPRQSGGFAVARKNPERRQFNARENSRPTSSLAT